MTSTSLLVKNSDVSTEFYKMNDAYNSLPKVRSTTLTHLKIRKTYFVLGHYWWRTQHPPSLELQPFMKKICCNYLNIWETLEDAKVQDFQVSAKWKHTKKSQGFCSVITHAHTWLKILKILSSTFDVKSSKANEQLTHKWLAYPWTCITWTGPVIVTINFLSSRRESGPCQSLSNPV